MSFEAGFDVQPSHGPSMTHQELLEDGGLPSTIKDLGRQRLAIYSKIMSSTIDRVLHPHRKEERKDTRFLRSTFLPALQEKLKKKLGEDTLVESQFENIQGFEFVVSLIVLDSEVRGVQQTILFTIEDGLAEFGFRESTGLLHYSEGTTEFNLPVTKAGAASIIPESSAQGASQSSGSIEAELAQVPEALGTPLFSPVDQVVGEMVNQIIHQIVEDYRVMEDE